MPDFISPLFWYILTIGILVTVHEWGHFAVARRCGVHVLRFSVGFGRALYSRTGKNGTEYRLALIPFGGYVKMLDEREQEVPPELQPFAFNRQSVGKRFAIVAAGPLANLILCIGLLWAAFIIGVPELRALIGPSTGLAQQAGFQTGDELIAVDAKPVQAWNDALPALALAAMDRRPIDVQVTTLSGHSESRRLALDALPEDYPQDRLLQEIGLTPFFSASLPIVGQVQKDGPADGVLQPGDQITAIDGAEIAQFGDIPRVLAEKAGNGRNLRVEIIRNGVALAFLIAPVQIEDQGQRLWRLGIGSLSAVKTVQYPALQALPAALSRTYTMTRDSLSVIKRLLTGAASVDNLSGPIGIARAADSQASWGISPFLGFLAAISLALCIMNLLPIPLLDGGHLLYFAYEWATGKAPAESVQAIGQYIGVFLLAGLLGIAIFNDFFRIIS
ncbi:RIP metalloprotease RseP [Arenimonas sp. GDDSR-1]|uniref:RIP metalloprotease RseP n=1 Tax=Arenimonas sp. GDDSR-1 TaxID=2950125 RepID=UPI00261FC94B|nr:RIP metalloprotease RseP [Arenimonas sp. GDDSR-1]